MVISSTIIASQSKAAAEHFVKKKIRNYMLDFLLKNPLVARLPETSNKMFVAQSKTQMSFPLLLTFISTESKLTAHKLLDGRIT